jgi:hypothetical protein
VKHKPEKIRVKRTFNQSAVIEDDDVVEDERPAKRARQAVLKKVYLPSKYKTFT